MSTGARGEQPTVPAAEFRSYSGQPILNKPVWGSPDIPGYLFLGGLAGAGSALAAGAQLTGRAGLARVMKLGCTTAAGLSLVALVHDLGRRDRFLNMLRTFKPTSPMSVGSWLLSAYAPAATIAALSDLTGIAEPVGSVATAVAALLGPEVAAYTAALICDTAVPAWHDGFEEMPFVFVASAASAAGGLGMLAAPLAEVRPARLLGTAGAVIELAVVALMQQRMGMPREAYRQGKAKRFSRAAQLSSGAGVALAVAGRGRAATTRLSGAALVIGSALERWAIFEAGLSSAEDPRYTVVPQRQRLERRSRDRPGRSARPPTAGWAY